MEENLWRKTKIKIRTSLIANSSTSSFIVVGACFKTVDLNSPLIAQKWKDDNKDGVFSLFKEGEYRWDRLYPTEHLEELEDEELEEFKEDHEQDTEFVPSKEDDDARFLIGVEYSGDSELDINELLKEKEEMDKTFGVDSKLMSWAYVDY